MSVETTIEHLASNVTGVQAGPSESIDALHTGELIVSRELLSLKERSWQDVEAAVK